MIVLLQLLVGVNSKAQVTTAGIAGMIRDDENKPLPGATIKAVHMPSGSTYGTATQDNGHFNIQGMRAGGPYTIEIFFTGFASQKVEEVTLVLGENYILNARLGQSTVEIKGVDVTGNKNTVLNSDRTGAATNINARTIARMPTISRSITDFTRLTPQANGNGFAGRDGRYNNVQIDGANFNNGFGISSDPLPGGGNQPVSLDAIEEVQVNIAPYDVRQTGFTGAGINAVTRSGTNDISGSAYAFLRPKSFTGLNVGDQKLADNNQNSSKIIGGRIGLPIIKNKLFFFGNFEYEDRQSVGNTWLAARPGLTGGNVTSVAATDLELVRDYLIKNYQYDPGAYENYKPNYLNKNIKALARLDWNISNKHKLTLRYNQMTGTNDQGTNANSGPNPRSGVNRIGSESIAFENANYSFKNKVMSVTGELNSIFSQKISNQFLATYSRIRDTRETPGDLFPFVDIWNNGKNYMSFGTELFSYNNDVINNNLSFIDNITYSINKHTITGGISFQTMSYANSYQRMGTSYYRYNSVSDFLNGGKPSVYGTTYLYPGQDQYARVKFGLGGLYLQDKFAVSDKLMLTGGIRADLPLFLDNPPANPVIDTMKLLDNEGNVTSFTTAKWPKSKVLLSPRIGFNFDVLGDRTLQLRGGTGIFTGNIPFVWFTNMPTNAGVIQNTFEPVDTSTLRQITRVEKDPMYWPNQLPEKFPSKPSTKAPGSFALIDPEFKMPQVWRTNLGADYKVPNTPLIATVDLIYTKDINAVYQYNANRKEATKQLNNSGDDRDFWNGSNSARYNSSTGAIIPVLSNTNKGHSYSGTAGLTLNQWKGISGSLFYTYSASKDISGNPGSAAASAWSNNYSINDPNEQLLGYSQYAIPHRIVSTLSYRKEYLRHLATTVSLFYQGANQGRFAYTYNGDINTDGVSLDLLYVPSNSSTMIFEDIKDSKGVVLFTAVQQREAYDKFVDNSKVLRDSKGDYVKRNCGLMPWYNRWDFRLLQDVFVNVGKNKQRHTLQVSLDILNVGNLLSKNWGIYKQLNGGSDYNYGLLKVTKVDAQGVPSYNMITVTDPVTGKLVMPETPFRNQATTGSTWGMQLGLRYSF